MAAESCQKQMSCAVSISGIGSFVEEVANLRSYKNSFVVSTFEDINPITLQVISSGGLDRSTNVRDVPTPEQLSLIFNECRQNLKHSKGYFVAYDFGYYNEHNNFRDIIVMISLIPDTMSVKEKMAYSTNMGYIMNALNIAHHIPLHELDEFTYDHIGSECSRFQRK